MEATELRIGNQIMDKPSEKTGMVDLVILQILEENPNNTYIPIPLTEEWIEKLGFEFYDYELDDDQDTEENETGVYKSYKIDKSKNLYYLVTINSDNSIEFCIKSIWTQDVLLSSIKYVHQLQNLYFAITGKELTIKELAE